MKERQTVEDLKDSLDVVTAALEVILSYSRMCSLDVECVLLMLNVFCYLKDSLDVVTAALEVILLPMHIMCM